MINVVFLLLIFFLMSAQIAPAPPVAVALPSSASETPAVQENVLYLSAEGIAYYAGLSGPMALDALASKAPETLTLQADATLRAGDLARLLPQLGAWGIETLDIVTEPQP